LYYIRAYLASGSYDTAPVEDVIFTDIMLWQYLGIMHGTVVEGQESEAVAVEGVISFNATPLQSSVLLEWETASETEILGFELYRTTERDLAPNGCPLYECADGQMCEWAGDDPICSVRNGIVWRKINDKIILAQGMDLVGYKYSLLDTQVVNGITYYYLLEGIFVDGHSEFEGPISATPEASVALSRKVSGRMDISVLSDIRPRIDKDSKAETGFVKLWKGRTLVERFKGLIEYATEPEVDAGGNMPPVAIVDFDVKGREDDGEPDKIKWLSAIDEDDASKSNFVINRGDVVILDGSSSYDPEGELLYYSWELVELPDGSYSELVDDASPQTHFAIDSLGTYRVCLRVFDGIYFSDDAKIIFYVNEHDADKDLWHLDVEIEDTLRQGDSKNESSNISTTGEDIKISNNGSSDKDHQFKEILHPKNQPQSPGSDGHGCGTVYLGSRPFSALTVMLLLGLFFIIWGVVKLKDWNIIRTYLR
jgi:hypothetical protein